MAGKRKFFGIETNTKTKRETVHIFETKAARDEWVDRREGRWPADSWTRNGVAPSERRAASEREAENAARKMEKGGALPVRPVVHKTLDASALRQRCGNRMRARPPKCA